MSSYFLSNPPSFVLFWSTFFPFRLFIPSFLIVCSCSAFLYSFSYSASRLSSADRQPSKHHTPVLSTSNAQCHASIPPNPSKTNNTLLPGRPTGISCGLYCILLLFFSVLLLLLHTHAHYLPFSSSMPNPNWSFLFSFF